MSNNSNSPKRIEPIQAKIDLKVLDSKQLQQIRDATLHVLENVGVRFPSECALDVFSKHGAFVDKESQNVKLPADIVLSAMSKAPRTFTLSGRAPNTDFLVGGGNSYFATDGCGVETMDFETGELQVRQLWLGDMDIDSSVLDRLYDPGNPNRRRRSLLAKSLPEAMRVIEVASGQEAKWLRRRPARTGRSTTTG